MKDENAGAQQGVVNYELLDPHKVEASRAAAETSQAMEALGFRILSWSRGESALVFEHKGTGLLQACVIEGLGTKNIVAENPTLRALYGKTFYDRVAKCNVRMSHNDLITVGALPYLFGQHTAIGSNDHLSGPNGHDLVTGTVQALQEDGTTYGPGETPFLRDVICPGTVCLSGFALGIIRSGDHLINPAQLRPGLRIVLLGSSGIHSNGLTDCRDTAAALPQGYLTNLGDGDNRTFGEALLTPTQTYVPFVKYCQDIFVHIYYAVNITGHGWRKLMRAPQPFTYRITKTPKPQRIFTFIQEVRGFTPRKMYGTFNMGAGFAVFVDVADVPLVERIGGELGIPVLDAGCVEEGPRQVVIEPIGETYDELSLR